MRFVRIKRVCSDRFYINPKPEQKFFGGNVLSQGVAELFFYVQAPESEPWDC